MRDGWVETRLDEVANVTMGQSPPGSTYNDQGNGLPFIQGNGEFGTDHPTPNKWCSEPRKVAQRGDVLLSVRAPVGATNIANRATAVGRGLAVLNGKPGLAETRFIRLLLQGSATALAVRSTGSTFDAITGKALKALPVSIPPIEEQRRIVDLMSHVDGDIETQVSEIRATIRCWTGALRAAQPTKGAEHPLTRIFSFVIGGAWGSPPGEDETNVLALGTSAFAGDALTVDPGRGTERSLSVDRAQKRGIMRGDILLERSGGSPTQPVGRVIRALEDSQHVVPSDFQRLLRPDTELIDAGFAFWTLWMNYQDGVVLPYQKNTTSIRNLQVTEYLNNARIVIPDMSAQRDWVALAQQFEHLVDTQRVQLGRSRALRSSLLTALLSGEHAVPDSYDEFIRNEGAA